MPIPSAITAISGCYPDIAVFINIHFHKGMSFIINRHFLPFRRADFTAYASLRRTRSGRTTASYADASHLQQTRLVNNQVKLLRDKEKLLILGGGSLLQVQPYKNAYQHDCEGQKSPPVCFKNIDLCLDADTPRA